MRRDSYDNFQRLADPANPDFFGYNFGAVDAEEHPLRKDHIDISYVDTITKFSDVGTSLED